MTQALTKTMILISIITMDILTGMEFDIFIPSFSELQNHFSQSTAWIEASLSFNFAGYCLGLFFVGGLADRYGQKSIILLGLTTFIIGSIFCLWSPSYNLLLIGRFLQGVGIASPATLSFLIISNTYPVKDQQSLIAMLNGALSIATAVAPVIGSYVTLHFHWQGNFLVLLLLGMIVLTMTIIFIPNYVLSKPRSASLLGWNISIFRSKPLMLLIASIIFMFVPYWIFVGMSPLLYIKNLNVSLAHFGYYQGSLALAFGLGSILYGFIIKNTQYSQKKVLRFSIQILPLSLTTLTLTTVFNSQSPLLITLSFLPFIIGHIIPTTILYPACLGFLPEAKGQVSAILQGGRLILSAIGLQIASYFYQESFRNIGIIIILFVVTAIIALFSVIKNDKVMSIVE